MLSTVILDTDYVHDKLFRTSELAWSLNDRRRALLASTMVETPTPLRRRPKIGEKKRQLPHPFLLANEAKPPSSELTQGTCRRMVCDGIGRAFLERRATHSLRSATWFPRLGRFVGCRVRELSPALRGNAMARSSITLNKTLLDRASMRGKQCQAHGRGRQMQTTRFKVLFGTESHLTPPANSLARLCFF